MIARPPRRADREPRRGQGGGTIVRVGVFIEEARAGIDHAEAFRETLELVDEAEAGGLHGVWFGELHFTPGRSVLSAPTVLAAAVAMRTRRLRIGTAVHVLPLVHPLRIAEEVATLDHLSQGRVDFGIGRSGAVRTYEVFGIPYDESQARFQEALAIILEAWKGEAFSHDGRFYRFDKAAVSPRPYQEPHPPLRMAATTEDTFPQVGSMGLPIWVGLRTMGIEDLAPCVAAYRSAWRDAGHGAAPSVYLRIPIYAAPTAAEAVADGRETVTHYFRRQAELALAGLAHATGERAGRRRAQAERLAALPYDEILADRVAFGAPRDLVERLSALGRRLDLDGIVAELNPGGLIPPGRVRRSLSILAREVAPALA
jgi:alkanesulfonate monooxygenase SsuD/methylene tetrahydromethanopterin reductase-like flavin-dependent oxidoreductase (luciferase family)